MTERDQQDRVTQERDRTQQDARAWVWVAGLLALGGGLASVWIDRFSSAWFPLQ